MTKAELRSEYSLKWDSLYISGCGTTTGHGQHCTSEYALCKGCRRAVEIAAYAQYLELKIIKMDSLLEEVNEQHFQQTRSHFGY